MTTIRFPEKRAALRAGRPPRLGRLSAPVALSVRAPRPLPVGASRSPGVGDIVCPDGSAPPCPETISARLFVGLKRGIDARECAGEPAEYTPREIDRLVLAQRAGQVGDENAGATRYTAEGVYRGQREPTAVYELFPAAGESRAEFFDRARKLAQSVATLACQREVYVEESAGETRVTESARFEGARGRRRR